MMYPLSHQYTVISAGYPKRNIPEVLTII